MASRRTPSSGRPSSTSVASQLDGLVHDPGSLDRHGALSTRMKVLCEAPEVVIVRLDELITVSRAEGRAWDVMEQNSDLVSSACNTVRSRSVSDQLGRPFEFESSS